MTTFTIAALLPGLQNTNGDAENAAVLARRAAWAGLDARVVPVESRDDLPEHVDAVVLGSGSDSALEASRRLLLGMHDELRTWGTEGGPIPLHLCLRAYVRARTESIAASTPGRRA